MHHTVKFMISLLCWLFLGYLTTYGQQIKPDSRIQILKEDGLDRYQSQYITSLDLLQALDFMGVRLHKFALGRFDQKYQLHIVAETFQKGELVKTDTLLAGDNEYIYFEPGETEYAIAYIDQLKFITRSDDNQSEVRLYTYALSTKMDIELPKWDDQQFYNWRFFADARWELNRNIPLMVFASSWEDEQYGVHRFCGVVKLEEGEEDTAELLQYSPAYVLFSYRVTPVVHP